MKEEEITQENINGLLYAVTLLPERIQEMIRLRYEEKQTYRKIAETMGVTAERIRFLLRDAEAKLRMPGMFKHVRQGRQAQDEYGSEDQHTEQNAPKNIMQTEIKDMGMSVRTTNRLIARGCYCLADVVALNKDEILNIKLVGKLSRMEVAAKLEELGILDSAWSKLQ